MVPYRYSSLGRMEPENCTQIETIIFFDLLYLGKKPTILLAWYLGFIARLLNHFYLFIYFL